MKALHDHLGVGGGALQDLPIREKKRFDCPVLSNPFFWCLFLTAPNGRSKIVFILFTFFYLFLSILVLILFCLATFPMGNISNHSIYFFIFYFLSFLSKLYSFCSPVAIFSFFCPTPPRGPPSLSPPTLCKTHVLFIYIFYGAELLFPRSF